MPPEPERPAQEPAQPPPGQEPRSGARPAEPAEPGPGRPARAPGRRPWPEPSWRGLQALPGGTRLSVCGRRAPQWWTTPIGRTRPSPGAWPERPCSRRRTPLRVRRPGPWPLLSSWSEPGRRGPLAGGSTHRCVLIERSSQSDLLPTWLKRFTCWGSRGHPGRPKGSPCRAVPEPGGPVGTPGGAGRGQDIRSVGADALHVPATDHGDQGHTHPRPPRPAADPPSGPSPDSPRTCVWACRNPVPCG